MELMAFQPGEAAPDKKLMKELLRLGVPVGLMNSVTAIGGMLLQGIINGFGYTAVAAYTASSKIVGLVEQPGSIIGLSLGTYVGQNLGAGRMDRIRTGVRRAIVMSFVVNALLSFVLIVFGREMIMAFVSGVETDVIETAYPYLFVAGLMEWSLGLLFVYRFSLQSMGDTVMPLISGALELFLRVSVVLLLSQVFHMGFSSVYIADVTAWFGAALLLCVTYYVRIHRAEGATGLFKREQSDSQPEK